MSDVLQGLYQVILERKDNPVQDSYTCYLFEKGLDKILKKCGEESAEVIIAAKNGIRADTVEEICDLTYHLLVLMAQSGITTGEVAEVLESRRQKIGNLKTFHSVERES